jgi:hypothetical protein
VVPGLVARRRARESPTVVVQAKWRTRIDGVKRTIRRRLVVGVIVGLVVGLDVQLRGYNLGRGLRTWLLYGLIVVVSFGLFDYIRAGTSTVEADPPRRLAGRGLGAVLTATRNAGLVSGMVVVVALVLSFGLFGAAIHDLAWGLAFGLTMGLVFGVVGGLVGGLDAWLYHHWLRRQLACEGLLPRRLQPFLEWCAAPEQGWLRVSDACEFRHRDLLDHLASRGEPDELRIDSPEPHLHPFRAWES